MSHNQRCPGCYPVYQANQLGHMVEGGCMYIEDNFHDCNENANLFINSRSRRWWNMEEAAEAQRDLMEELAAELSNQAQDEDEDDDDWVTTDDENEEPAEDAEAEEAQPEEPKEEINCHECLVKPLCENPAGVNLDECPLCYEKMEMVNLTITRCGHTFHSSCVFKALEYGDNCPMCRVQLTAAAPIEDEDEEGEGSEISDDEEEVEEEDGEDTLPSVSLEDLSNKLINMGYTIPDIMRVMSCCFLKSRNEERYTKEFADKMDEDIEAIINGGRMALSLVDKRSYAEVLRANVPQQQNV